MGSDALESDGETWLLFRQLYGIVLEHDRTNAQPKIDRLEAEARSLITAHAETAARRERERCADIAGTSTATHVYPPGAQRDELQVEAAKRWLELFEKRP